MYFSKQYVFGMFGGVIPNILNETTKVVIRKRAVSAVFQPLNKPTPPLPKSHRRCHFRFRPVALFKNREVLSTREVYDSQEPLHAMGSIPLFFTLSGKHDDGPSAWNRTGSTWGSYAIILASYSSFSV